MKNLTICEVILQIRDMVDSLSKKLEIQLIINTHMVPLVEIADTVIDISDYND